jgi:hypothetical protein
VEGQHPVAESGVVLMEAVPPAADAVRSGTWMN